MYERTCCKISNAIATTRRTRATKIFNENKEKCKCQRNFQTQPDFVTSVSNQSRTIQTNANMQTLQRPQQQQTANQLHLQMPTESSSEFNGESASLTGISSGSASPSSPLSTSSLSSSESSTTQTTPSLGVNLRVTGQCSQGGRKYMEDYFSVAYQHSENAKDLEYAFFGIFDGHGGAEAATFAKEHLMMEIINQKLFWSDSDVDVLRAIREGYIATHFAMWREQDKWPKTANGLPSTAGTTATVAFIRHEKIYIGHVGDSGIVLGYQNDGEKCWRAKQLTIDHKPESMTERSRIMRSGGKVVVKSGVPRVVWNRPRNADHRGPIRQNTPIDEIPFLAVARSLGDLWSYNSISNEFVVSPDPDVRVIKINPKTFRCLIFGTDGLWNVVTPQEAVNTVFHNETVNDLLQRQRGENVSNENGWMNPSKVLVERALGTWSAKKMRADNTSVVTVILHPPHYHGSNHRGAAENACATSKFDSNFGGNYGVEFSHMGAAFSNRDSISYHDMAEKYLPPEEYRNFNFYEEEFECNGSNVNNAHKAYYDKRYAKSAVNEHRYSFPNTLEALEFMWDSREQLDRINEFNSKPRNEISVGMNDEDNDDTDEENWDDTEEEDDNEEGDIDPIVVPNGNDSVVLSDLASQYIPDGKEISQTTNELNVNSCSLRSIDDTTTSSYMSTFVESYNSLLGDNVASDAMSADVSTSNSSNSYKSHSASCMQELVQEQQRYQQQCMSEEEGYSLTKLETRREQRCNVTGVQTFRIFQQRQQEADEQSINQGNVAANHVETTSTLDQPLSCPQNYSWESRFPSGFSSNQSNQSYQQEQQQQAQQHQFMLEQQLKSLELNSLLQQEREEEQQVEFERQMGMERLQQQQRTLSNPPSENCEKSTVTTSDFLLVHRHDNASSELLSSTLTDNCESKDETLVDIPIHEEYLVLDDESEAVDASVQINEISSSSSSSSLLLTSSGLLDSDHALVKPQIPCSNSTMSCVFLSPMSSFSKPLQPEFVDAFEPTSDCDDVDVPKEPPKIIEKLENIEILHEKPEFIIEAVPLPPIRTRSKRKLNTLREAPLKRRCKPNNETLLHFPNVPNENQHQHPVQPKKAHQPSLKNGMLHIRAAENALDIQTILNKRQLRSTSNTSISSREDVGSSNSCSNAPNSGSSCYQTQKSLNNNIDYAKRTLRTRNSLAKDLKAKTNLLSSGIKRSATGVTTRFLRTQAVNLLSMHHSQQVSGPSSCKKQATTAAAASSLSCTPGKSNQPQPSPPKPQQQRPLTATTFNFINLRSRKIGANASNNNTNNLASYSKQCQQSTTTPTVLSRPAAKSMQTNNMATSTSTPVTTNYARRNLRSLNTMRPCIKGKVSLSTSTNGLYCKSMRSQALTALVTPPPPSPKLLNPAAANVAFAVTRARKCVITASTKPLLLNSPIDLQCNRKRTMRSNQINQHQQQLQQQHQHNETPMLSVTRAQKRLRR